MVIEAFLPQGLFARPIGEIIRTIPAESIKPATATYEGYSIPGCLISVRDECWGKIVADASVANNPLVELDLVAITEEERLVRIWGVLPEVEFDIQNNAYAEANKDAVAAYKTILTMLSLRTGQKVCLHIVSPPCHTPLPVEDGVLHLIIGASPPGIHLSTWMGMAFGVHVLGNCNYLSVHGPTEGYGTLVYDPLLEKQVNAQIVGKTAYLFAPCLEAYANAGATIFEKLLVSVWNTLVSDPEETQRPDDDKDVCIGLLQSWNTHLPEYWKKEIAAGDRKIAALEEEITKLLVERRTLQQSIRGALAQDVKSPEQIADDFYKLLRAPGVARIVRVGNGLNILTKRAYWRLDHPEKPIRFLGRYWIRFGENGKFGIWGEEYGHPKRILHPHISTAGTACFGDLRQKVRETVTLKSTTETMALLWRWIEESYNPDSADTPVEEFLAVEVETQ